MYLLSLALLMVATLSGMSGQVCGPLPWLHCHYCQVVPASDRGRSHIQQVTAARHQHQQHSASWSMEGNRSLEIMFRCYLYHKYTLSATTIYIYSLKGIEDKINSFREDSHLKCSKCASSEVMSPVNCNFWLETVLGSVYCSLNPWSLVPATQH